jgi:hypothetical protein
MTEQEWLACSDPVPMLEYLRGRASERKLRLFAVACCRRIWSCLTEKRSRWIVEISERYADGRATQDRLNSAWEKADVAFQAVHLSGGGDVEQNPAQAVLGLKVDLEVNEVVEMAAASVGAVARGEAYERIWRTPAKDNEERWAEDDAIRNAAEAEERRAQAILLREVIGNPFLPTPTIAPAWLHWQDGTIPKIAQCIYDERAFDRLPILADALEEAGCYDAEMLIHCRGPGPHVRGCWVIDLLLGKE